MNRIILIALLLTATLEISRIAEAKQITTLIQNDAAPTPSATQSGRYGEIEFGEPVNVDRCKSGKKGYLYWAAREHVFAFRFDPAKPVYPRRGNPNVSADEFIPPAPDPSEPEGCYGNPLRGSAMPYMWNYSADLFQKLAGRRFWTTGPGPDPHSFFAIRDQFQLRDDHNEFNRKMFLKATDCRLRDSGVMECHFSAGRSKEYFTQLLKIESKALFDNSKDGYDVYALISVDIPSQLSLEKNGKALDSTFDLFGSVRLRDSFRIFPNEIDLLVPYYRSMIRYIVEARVPNYSWTPIKAAK